jgi:hypothetical protein
VTFIFALFFLLLGFIGGIFLACDITLKMIRNYAEENSVFLDKYRITLTGKDQQE